MDDSKINTMKICVLVSYDNNYKEMAKYTVDGNIKKYCELHGYHLWEDKQEEIYNGKSPQWQKIRVAKEVLKTNQFDWIFFMDTDCLIMNPDIKLESFVENETCSFIVPRHSMKAVDTPIELEGILSIHNIISSQFFVKNDEYGLAILEDIWLAKGNDKINKFDYEGRQIRMLINSKKYEDHIKIIDERSLNRFWYVNNPFMVFNIKGINDNVWQKGDFIVHVTAYSKEERIKILSDLNYFSGLNDDNEV
jgi:mannan polymerase II complex MNN10 subunit